MVKYVWVRVRREDFEKIIQNKKIPIERDLRMITGKQIKISNPQLFKIAANSVWDLGEDFQGKIIKAIRFKKGDLKI